MSTVRKQTPNEFLKQLIGRPVVVKLSSGVDYRGIFANLDGYMNVILEQTEEYMNGELKNKYGDTFIRGNNVLYISAQKRRL
ncbi:U6 snRNA-associated Sm-like protein LSm6 [Bolinopsis microptera]|uniref:U6 snRNA-associated Sm-like protein LSm6 n=1 Tax=Bolinopsis microptera TaxID=2820187 RepID=UPI00307A081A